MAWSTDFTPGGFSLYDRQLDAFIKVAETGSFGKAAEQLYVSRPAVIQQVKLLEARCG